MINEINKATEMRMKKCFDAFKNNISKIRSGRISPNLFDDIKIKCYNSVVMLRQLANIVIEDSHSLSITVFDQQLIPIIKKSIMDSDLGINLSFSGTIIYARLPYLTEDRRRNLIKLVRTEAENGRVSIRNIRRDTNHKIKTLLKNKTISADQDRCLQSETQKITNIWIKKIDSLLAEKETELIKV